MRNRSAVAIVISVFLLAMVLFISYPVSAQGPSTNDTDASTVYYNNTTTVINYYYYNTGSWEKIDIINGTCSGVGSFYLPPLTPVNGFNGTMGLSGNLSKDASNFEDLLFNLTSSNPVLSGLNSSEIGALEKEYLTTGNIPMNGANITYSVPQNMSSSSKQSSNGNSTALASSVFNFGKGPALLIIGTLGLIIVGIFFIIITNRLRRLNKKEKRTYSDDKKARDRALLKLVNERSRKQRELEEIDNRLHHRAT